MNLTSRSRYALKIMMDLAFYRHLPHVRRRDIATRQGIPTTYLDQIMVKLRAGELVESIRGRGGGYRLMLPAEQISVWDIFSAVEDSIYPAQCVDHIHDCTFDQVCIARSAWEVIIHALKDSLVSLRLSELVRDGAKIHHLCPVGGIKECRPGRSSSVVRIGMQVG